MYTYIIVQEKKGIPANTPEMWIVGIHETFREEFLELHSLLTCMTDQYSLELVL